MPRGVLRVTARCGCLQGDGQELPRRKPMLATPDATDWQPPVHRGPTADTAWKILPGYAANTHSRFKTMNYNETAPYSEFKLYTITDLEDCKNHLANSSQTRARAKEELEYRHTIEHASNT